MIIKGKSRTEPGPLAAHLGNAEKNERVQLLETRGVVAKDLRGALVEMDAYAAGSRCSKPLYHAAISPEPPHRLTPEQRTEAVDALEKKLGLEGHARAVVLHEKLGREHIHVVWSRIDIGTMKAVPDSHNYRKHEEVARDLERRFGHERVQGAHAEREGAGGEKVRRPERTPSRPELRQEEKTGVKGATVRTEVTQAFRASDGPEAFKAALEEKGYRLAQGDRRDFVVVDKAGGVHSLARRIEDVRAAELRATMAPLDREALPSAEDAKRMQIARHGERPENDDRSDKPKAEPTPPSDEERRRRREAGADHRGNKLEAAYDRGDGYVSQSQTALRDHKRRQAELDSRLNRDDAWERIESGEKERARRDREQQTKDAAAEHASPSASSSAESHGNIELSDAMRERLDRLAEHKAERGSGRDGAGPHGQAPGGGRTRGR